MIAFWVTREGSSCIHNYFDSRGRAIAGRFATPAYDDIGPVVRLSRGAQIFSTLDHLTPAQRAAARLLWDAHAAGAPQAARLNDPGRVLLRYDLLTRLAAEGINRFRVFPADAPGAAMPYPVFVRERDRHNGPLTGLLRTPAELTRAVRALRFRGYRRGELMIVEFCDAVGADGLVRKYAAFKVGDRIIAGHMFASRQWFLKSGDNEATAATLGEELAYIEGNPHQDWVRRVFAIAAIDFGRIDYGIAGGVPQAWEINLNPTMGRRADAVRQHVLPPDLQALREQGRQAFHVRLREAFLALDPGDDDRTIDVAIPAAMRHAMQCETAREQRHQRLVVALRALPADRRIGGPLRAIVARLFPRG
jgi:hypothetical protein